MLFRQMCDRNPQRALFPASMARAAKKVSEYGLQLRAKQNGQDAYYGVSEKPVLQNTLKWQREDPVWPVKTC